MGDGSEDGSVQSGIFPRWEVAGMLTGSPSRAEASRPALEEKNKTAEGNVESRARELAANENPSHRKVGPV